MAYYTSISSEHNTSNFDGDKSVEQAVQMGTGLLKASKPRMPRIPNLFVEC